MGWLYKNIGGKIKGLAIATFFVEAIGSILSGIVCLLTDEDLLMAALCMIFLGPIVAWVSSWLLYGFGELIDKVCNIEMNTRNGRSKMQIDNDIIGAEAEAAITREERERAGKELDIAREERIIDSITVDNVSDMSNYPEKVSYRFTDKIIAAETSETDYELRYHLRLALKSLKDPVESHIIKLLLELPDDKLRETLEKIREKYSFLLIEE